MYSRKELHLHTSSSTDTTENHPGSPSLARAEVMGNSSGSSPDVSGCLKQDQRLLRACSVLSRIGKLLCLIQADVEVHLRNFGPLEGNHAGPEAACDSMWPGARSRKSFRICRGICCMTQTVKGKAGRLCVVHGTGLLPCPCAAVCLCGQLHVCTRGVLSTVWYL